MNIDNIKNAIGNIDDDLIEAADTQPQKKAKTSVFAEKPWMKWAAAAAALVVIAGGVLITLNVTGATGAVAENDLNLGRQEPLNASSGFVSSDESSDESSEVYSETAMRAFEHFTAQLVAEYGYGVYPKDYSGFVIDNARNMLVIYLTDLNESTLQTYRDRMGENFADCVEYRKGDKSQRELWSITDKALTYLVKEAGVQIYSGRPSDKGDCIRIEIIKSDKSGAELAADLEERFGAPFDVAYYPYYSEDDVQEYAGTMDIVEGYDPHVVDGVEDGVMYVIRNHYKKYKLNVITRQQAIEKYGDYAAFKSKSQSAIIHPNGAVENVQALYNDEAEVKTVNGDFVKQKNEVVEYMIDGKQMQFKYFKSNTVKRYADSSVDGVERNYVIDYYKTDDDCVISRYEDGKRILHFSTASVFNGNREISKDDAVAIARRIAANSDFGVKGIDEASVEVSDYSCYTVVMTSKYGRFAASINYYGELRRISWAEDASLALTQERIEAAKAKMDAAIEKWKQERPGSRYVIQKVSFARIGDDIEAVFQVTHYLDSDVEACMGYIYYCLA